jgi:hypothetical protein
MIRKLAVIVLAAGLAATPAAAKDNGTGKGKGTTVHVVESERRPSVVRSVTGDRVVLFPGRTTARGWSSTPSVIS